MLCVGEQREVFETFCAEPYGVVLCISMSSYSYLFMLLGVHLRIMHVPHAEHMESLIGRNGEMQQRSAALRLSRSQVRE